MDGPRYCTLVGSVVRVDRDARGVFRGLGVCFEEVKSQPTDRKALKGFLSNAA